MSLKINYFVCAIVAIQITQIAIAQKTFHTTIQFPHYLDTKKVLIQYDNGKEIIKVTNRIINNRIIVHGKSYTKHVSLGIHYLNELKQSLFMKNYFLNYPSSSIKFTDTVLVDSLGSPFGNCLLANAVEVQKTKDAEKAHFFAKKEIDDLKNFFEKYKSEIDSNDSLGDAFYKMQIACAKKQLEFVEKNGNSYYAVWSFKNQIIGALINKEPQQLEAIFNKAFPKSFRQSVEGKEIQKIFNGINTTKKDFMAPWVASKDIKGNTINLRDYKDKYVLVQLWASWCGPCMAEMPVIKKIRDDYTEAALQIIGISYDTDYKAFYKAVSKNKLNWVQIFNNNDLRKRYGNKAIPSVYLIDKEGKIIFSNWEDSMETLDLLLKEKLLKNSFNNEKVKIKNAVAKRS